MRMLRISSALVAAVLTAVACRPDSEVSVPTETLAPEQAAIAGEQGRSIEVGVPAGTPVQARGASGSAQAANEVMPAAWAGIL